LAKVAVSHFHDGGDQLGGIGFAALEQPEERLLDIAAPNSAIAKPVKILGLLARAFSPAPARSH
jgi:hypothetical protein